jgi:hypothetical protein
MYSIRLQLQKGNNLHGKDFSINEPWLTWDDSWGDYGDKVTYQSLAVAIDKMDQIAQRCLEEFSHVDKMTMFILDSISGKHKKVWTRELK